MARKPTDTVTLSLRIREVLRRQLSQAAKSERHSMNAEIVDRLEKSFLAGNFLALLKEDIGKQVLEHIDNASTAAATKAAEQVVQQLKQRSNDNDQAS
jgi:hypothetical protein